MHFWLKNIFVISSILFAKKGVNLYTWHKGCMREGALYSNTPLLAPSHTICTCNYKSDDSFWQLIFETCLSSLLQQQLCSISIVCKMSTPCLQYCIFGQKFCSSCLCKKLFLHRWNITIWWWIDLLIDPTTISPAVAQLAHFLLSVWSDWDKRRKLTEA